MSADTDRTVPARVMSAPCLESLAELPANVRRLPNTAPAPVPQSRCRGRHGKGVVSLTSRPKRQAHDVAPARWLDLAPPSLGQTLEAQESALIEAAIAALTRRMSMQRPTHDLASVERVKQLAFLHLAHLDREHFAVAFVDAQLRLIAFEEMFMGTLTMTAAYPREIARRALSCNAAGVFLAHNHPSGDLTPSRADELLTHAVITSMTAIGVNMIDHIVVSRQGAISLAERGLI